MEPKDQISNNNEKSESQAMIADVCKRWAIRGLKGREVKQLKKDGIKLSTITPNQIDDAVDRVVGMVLSEKDLERLDDMPHVESIKVFAAVIAKTYGVDAG